MQPRVCQNIKKEGKLSNSLYEVFNIFSQVLQSLYLKRYMTNLSYEYNAKS